MPYAIFHYMGAFLRNIFAYVENVIPCMIWLRLSRLQANLLHRNTLEPSEPGLGNLHQHAPELSRTLRNLPRPSGTNLPEPFGTFRNLPLSGTTHWSLSGLKTPLAYAVGEQRNPFQAKMKDFGNSTHRS